MAFGTTLINKLTQNLDQRLAERRTRQLQEQQMQDQLKQNQLLFEQQQRQQLQAQPQQMQMQEAQIKNNARIQQELLAQAQQIPIKTTPGLRELLASGDMKKIQAELPRYIQTEGDVKFFNTYKGLAAKMIDPATQAYDKEKAIGRARSETLAGDIKAGIRAVPGTGRKSSSGSGGGSNGQSKTSKAEKKDLKAIVKELDNLAAYIEAGSVADPKETPEKKAIRERQLHDDIQKHKELSSQYALLRSTQNMPAMGAMPAVNKKSQPKQGQPTTNKPVTTKHGTAIIEMLKKADQELSSQKPPTRKAR